MRDYVELTKTLRYCSEYDNCGSRCPRFESNGDGDCVDGLLKDAADAIEELLSAARSVVHCKDCEWWTKQEASIQGRCARLAIYPTGMFYCASGSKREPQKGVE